MERIDKAKNKILIIAVVASILMIVGIPLIPIGANMGITIIMVAGIVFAAGGFYAVPLLWISYGGLKNMRRLVFAIEVEHLYTIKLLSNQLSKPEAEVRSLLNRCFQKCYLIGYRRDGDNIILNEENALKEKISTYSCPNCGAKFSHKGNNPLCPYCQKYLNK